MSLLTTLTRLATASSASIAGVSESYATNQLNQYLSAGPKTFTHDADGNLTSDGNRTFTWTAENRLKSVEPVLLLTGAEKVEFEYDYLGRRIQKTVSEWNGSFYAVTSDEKFFYDGWNLIAVYDAANSNALAKTHTWGLDLSQSLQGGVASEDYLALRNCQERILASITSPSMPTAM